MAKQLADCAEGARFVELMSLDQPRRQNRSLIVNRADSNQAESRLHTKIEHVRDSALLEHSFVCPTSDQGLPCHTAEADLFFAERPWSSCALAYWLKFTV